MNPSTAPTQAVAPVSPKKKTLRDHLESPAFLEQIAKALPRHMKAERMTRVAITAMTRTPALMDCTPESFCKCLLDLSALGLEPDGRRAHLIPFKDNRAGTTVCTLIVDYKGLAELAYNSGVVSYLHADVVREGDIFNFSKGELRDHVPWFLRRDADKPEEAGQVYAAYALARLKDGSEKVDVLSRSELDEIRDNSQGYKSAIKYDKPHPWINNRQEMDKKTAFRRLTKWLPLSPEIRDRIDSEDDEEARFSAAKPARVTIEPPVFLKAPETPAVTDEVPGAEAPPAASEPPKPTRQRRTVPAEPSPEPAPAEVSPRVILASLLDSRGVAFDDFRDWLVNTGRDPKADTYGSCDEVPIVLALALIENEGEPLTKCFTIYATRP